MDQLIEDLYRLPGIVDAGVYAQWSGSGALYSFLLDHILQEERTATQQPINADLLHIKDQMDPEMYAAVRSQHKRLARQSRGQIA